MSRPTFEAIYMRTAVELSRRSTCSRLQVGCVIASDDFRQILAVGYNGGAAGLENECESLDAGQCGHLHAEDNACIKCIAPHTQGKIVFCTDMPCAMCAKRLINLGGVRRVYYLRPYRLVQGVTLLGRAQIAVAQMSCEAPVPPNDPPPPSGLSVLDSDSGLKAERNVE